MGQDHEAPAIPFTRPVGSPSFYPSSFYPRLLRRTEGQNDVGWNDGESFPSTPINLPSHENAGWAERDLFGI